MPRLSRRPGFGIRRRLISAGFLPCATLAIILSGEEAAAQSLDRFSLDSVLAVDLFRGENTDDRPNIVIDIAAAVRIGEGWVLYVRPWLRQPRAPIWDKEIYQAALQYERQGPVSTRVDLGYIVSPIGLGMLDMRPGVNPTIAPHLSYFVSMPLFDAMAPRVRPIASSYPLGGQVTISTTRWDGRVALISSAPTRSYVINSATNPRATPVVVTGAGLTPTMGLRLGVSFAHGAYVTGDELAVKSERGRDVTIVAFEGEYAFGYTKLTGELTHDRFETTVGSETAVAWFMQGMHTLSPRWFVAARQEGTSAPPLRTGTVPGTRKVFHTTEATVGYRITHDLTVRGSFLRRKAFTRPTWDRQAGFSLVWAHRWR